MRYFVINIERMVNFYFAGKSINLTPMKHIERTMKDYELFFVTDGELYLNRNKETKIIENEIFLQAKTDRQKGTRAACSTFYWAHFDGDVKIVHSLDEVEKIKQGQGTWIFFPEHFSLYNSERVSIFFSEITHYRMEPNSDIILNCLMTALLAELCRQYEQTPVYKTNRRFGEILGYVHMHYKDLDFSLNKLADTFSYNTKYLSRLFRKNTGKTAVEYLSDLRINTAKQLLITSSESIYIIAKSVGFSNQYYFMNLFKKATGMTPTQYRNIFCGSNYT